MPGTVQLVEGSGAVALGKEGLKIVPAQVPLGIPAVPPVAEQPVGLLGFLIADGCQAAVHIKAEVLPFLQPVQLLAAQQGLLIADRLLLPEDHLHGGVPGPVPLVPLLGKQHRRLHGEFPRGQRPGLVIGQGIGTIQIVEGVPGQQLASGQGKVPHGQEGQAAAIQLPGGKVLPQGGGALEEGAAFLPQGEPFFRWIHAAFLPSSRRSGIIVPLPLPKVQPHAKGSSKTNQTATGPAARSYFSSSIPPPVIRWVRSLSSTSIVTTAP